MSHAQIQTQRAVTIRMPADTLAQLKDRYRQTYPEHGLNWNNWLLCRIRLSFLTEG